MKTELNRSVDMLLALARVRLKAAELLMEDVSKEDELWEYDYVLGLSNRIEKYKSIIQDIQNK